MRWNLTFKRVTLALGGDRLGKTELEQRRARGRGSGEGSHRPCAGQGSRSGAARRASRRNCHQTHGPWLLPPQRGVG